MQRWGSAMITGVSSFRDGTIYHLNWAWRIRDSTVHGVNHFLYIYITNVVHLVIFTKVFTKACCANWLTFQQLEPLAQPAIFPPSPTASLNVYIRIGCQTPHQDWSGWNLTFVLVILQIILKDNSTNGRGLVPIVNFDFKQVLNMMYIETNLSLDKLWINICTSRWQKFIRFTSALRWLILSIKQKWPRISIFLAI